ncbi:hypothetical protein QFC21_004993 [Naganishia friedmannii]|uniref:Uncharacterized protein n=1 Tax=Naganishia friedmannii TaxID=89922 RepID=A0ACC2VCC7_9TREE|nr:hypothetical protein QFC21_004993 [Naganishia friedmannii]
MARGMTLPPAYSTTTTANSSSTNPPPPTYTAPTAPLPRITITPPPSLHRTPTNTSTASTTSAPLPVYTARATTEPHTLSRALFHWGFVCPLLWVVGVAIIWIELRLLEEGEVVVDASTERERGEEGEEERVKRERERLVLDETIGIVRKVRCWLVTTRREKHGGRSN